jgi:hypothetical protein
LPRRQNLMDAVAQLMRQRHHVARFAEVVEHDIGMHGGDGRVGKGARGLAGFDARINPALGEEGGCDFRHARVEGGVGFADGLHRLVPADHARRFDRQRRVAVPDLQLVEAHPFGLQLVVAVRQFGIGRDDGVAQGLNHFRFDMVGKVTPGLRRGHLAPAVVDFLFLG